MDASSQDPPQDVLWGYPNGLDYGPDSFGSGADSPISESDVSFAIDQYMDDRPAWNVPPDQDRIRQGAGTSHPSWGTPGGLFRAIREGSHRYRLNTGQALNGQGESSRVNGPYQPVSAEPSNSNPTETVSEGWQNKVTSFIADANPSADEQIFVQTSMRQRYNKKDNGRAVMRCTDDARTPIDSRVMAMVEKVYSEGERTYDMFPYQIDQIERPFRWRTAGVGRSDWMETNEYNALTPVMRTPPTDPAQGIPEVPSDASDYGYTGEDTMYYG
jgi:hypothetical protein